jgi:hypothetical protein
MGELSASTIRTNVPIVMTAPIPPTSLAAPFAPCGEEQDSAHHGDQEANGDTRPVATYVSSSVPGQARRGRASATVPKELGQAQLFRNR